jgi:hypothetical protein
MGMKDGSPNASGSSSVKERQVTGVGPYSDSYDTTFGTTLTRLQDNIQSGKPIRYNDINDLMNLLNVMIGHYHNWTDLYQSGDTNLGGFGDSNYSRPGNLTTYSASAKFSTASALGWYNATQIHHIDQNNLASLSNSFVGHTHGYTDQTTG